MTAYASDHAADGESAAMFFGGLFGEVVLPTIEAEMSVLAKLGAPAGDRRRIEAVIAAGNEAIDEARESGQIASFKELEAQFAAANTLAAKYRVGACGDAGSLASGGGV